MGNRLAKMFVGIDGSITNVGTWSLPMRGGFEFDKARMAQYYYEEGISFSR